MLNDKLMEDIMREQQRNQQPSQQNQSRSAAKTGNQNYKSDQGRQSGQSRSPKK